MNRIPQDVLFAHANFRRFLLLILLLVSWEAGRSQCPWDERDTLMFVDGSQASLSAWSLEAPSDGGSWLTDSGAIGGIQNPGTGEWVYVSEALGNDIGTAALLSPAVTGAGSMKGLTLSFDFVLETYQDAGLAWVAVNNGTEWIKIMEMEEDYYGSVVIDVSEYSDHTIRFKFVFEDEGAWSWGMGLDNIMLSGRHATCGDGICEAGEVCASDCPSEMTAPGWIDPGEDLMGNPISYRKFARGASCDDCSEEIDLGFEFHFYDEVFRKIYINTNGNLTVREANTKFTPDEFCLEGTDMIAPFFADVDLSRGGSLSYYLDAAHQYLIVTWQDVPYYGCEGEDCLQTNTFQVILTDGTIREIGDMIIPRGANVLLSYGEMNWTTGTSSGGQYGYGGTPATVGINHRSGVICQDIGTFNRPGKAYYGNTMDLGCPPNEVGYLTGKTLLMNTELGEIVEPSYALMLRGEQDDVGHLLTWTTERPEDWDYFSIESGTDTSSFEELVTITALAHPQLPLGMYSYQPEQGDQRQWYRVTGITTSGGIQHSNWVEISQPVDLGVQLLSLGPNPLNGPLHIRVQVDRPGEIAWRLTSMSGQILNQGSWEGSIGLLEEHVSFPELSAGTYVFSIMGTDAMMQYRYVVKL